MPCSAQDSPPAAPHKDCWSRMLTALLLRNLGYTKMAVRG